MTALVRPFRFGLTVGLLSIVCGVADPAVAGEMLRYAGATTLQRDFMPEAAALFAAESGIRISLSGGNTDPGIKALLEGSVDIAGAGRALRPAERAAGLREVQIGWDPLVVLVHRNNPVSNLTQAQLRSVFSGAIRNWKEVGGRDEAIVVVNGPAGSGMYAAVRDLILSGAAPSPATITTPVVSDEDQLVAQFPAGICAISKSMVDQAEVKQLSIAGLKNGDAGYPLLKPLYLVTRGAPSAAATRFVKFALGPQGQNVIGKKFLPLASR